MYKLRVIKKTFDWAWSSTGGTYECSPSEDPTPIPLILVLKNNPFRVKRELFHSQKDPYFFATLTYIYIDYTLSLY